MNTQILANPELPFAVIGIIISFLCQRITLVYARGGIIDNDFFSLILGTIANYAWISSIIWFIFEKNWLIPIIIILISLFGFNTIVTISRPIIHKFRNVLRIMSIFCLLGMWHTNFI